jgi:hypothetical protein
MPMLDRDRAALSGLGVWGEVAAAWLIAAASLACLWSV